MVSGGNAVFAFIYLTSYFTQVNLITHFFYDYHFNILWQERHE